MVVGVLPVNKVQDSMQSVYESHFDLGASNFCILDHTMTYRCPFGFLLGKMPEF
jgi:hypothetical protein